MTTRAIIFDFDGVLADSERHHYLSYSEVFSRYGHTIDESKYYTYWTSLGLGPKGEIERHGLDLEPSTIRKEKAPIFSRYCRDGSIQLFDEAREIVECLGTDKVLTIASGSTRDDIAAILENADLLDAFDSIIGSDTVKAIKPAPDIFNAMLDALELEPYECMVIEDAEKGLLAALAADIPVIVVRTKETKDRDFATADIVFDSHAEMRDVIRDIYS